MKLRQEINYLRDKWIEFDLNRPGELRKYWIPFILGIAFTSFAPIFFNTLLLLPLLLILIPIVVLLSALSPNISPGANQDIENNIKQDYEMTDEEKKDMRNGFWLLENSRSLLGQISGFILFFPLLFAPFTHNLVQSLVISFPILEDLSFNLSFVNFNLLAWIKTILNLLQFMLVFYCTRKIKKTLKKKISSRIEKKHDFTHYIQRINKLGKNKDAI